MKMPWNNDNIPAIKYSWSDESRDDLENIANILDKDFNGAVYELTHKQYDGPEFFWLGRQGVPVWLMEKSLDPTELWGAQLAYNIEVERETEKALLLCFETDFGNITMWAPKSVVKGF